MQSVKNEANAGPEKGTLDKCLELYDQNINSCDESRDDVHRGGLQPDTQGLGKANQCEGALLVDGEIS